MGRVLRRLVAVVIGVCALLGAVRLVVPATAGTADEPPGVRRQLTFLRAALDGGAGDQAQSLFPEGYFFLHALYGLSWVELGMRAPDGERSAALREARWALARLESPPGRAPFSADLTPPHGVFYRGWTNWLRGGTLALQPSARRDPAELRRFADDSAALAGALANYGELAGLPIDTPWTKRYAFGLLPIGDAFLAWSKTARPWMASTPSPPPATISWWWRTPLLALLLVIGVIPWLPVLVRRYGARRVRPEVTDESSGVATE